MIKKIMAVTASAVMMLAMSVTAFAAGTIDATEQKILDELKAKKVTANYISQAENYLAKDDVAVTEAQATSIIANIDKAADIAAKAGIKTKADLSKADAAVVDSIIAEVKSAAAVVDLKVSYNTKNGDVSIVDKDNKVVATSNVGIKKTGADSMTTVAVVSGLGLAVAGLAVVSKKNAKAEA